MEKLVLNEWVKDISLFCSSLSGQEARNEDAVLIAVDEAAVAVAAESKEDGVVVLVENVRDPVHHAMMTEEDENVKEGQEVEVMTGLY